MRGTVIVQTQAEYDKWMASQQTYYAGNAPGAAAPEAPAAAKPAGGEAKPEVKADSTKAVTMK